MGDISHDALGGVVDIEDLVEWSKDKQVCAYYLGRQLADKSEILLIPYNYLLDEKLRNRHKIQVANTIVIVDEAHNVEQVCEDSASLSITSTDLAGAIRECDEVANVIDGGIGLDPNADPQDLDKETKKSTTNLYKNRNVQRISFGPREKCNSKLSKLLDRKGNDSTANGIVRNISEFRIYTR
jgi:Rad3-related DNA helicase